LLLVVNFWYTAVQQASANIARGRAVAGPFEPESLAMFHFVAQATPPEAVMVFFKPREMTMFTGRRAIMLINPLDVRQANYFVLHKRVFNPYFQIPAETLLKYAQELQLRNVYENPKFIVYQVGSQG